jgi:hypothetical protein
MTDRRAAGLPHMPIFARSVHKLAPLIILAWLGLVVVLSVFLPPLDKVAKQHQVSMSPQSAASMQPMKRGVERIRQRQRDHDRAGRRQTAGRRGPPLLRPDRPQTRG